jgi:hypothetical protein
MATSEVRIESRFVAHATRKHDDAAIGVRGDAFLAAEHDAVETAEALLADLEARSTGLDDDARACVARQRRTPEVAIAGCERVRTAGSREGREQPGDVLGLRITLQNANCAAGAPLTPRCETSRSCSSTANGTPTDTTSAPRGNAAMPSGSSGATVSGMSRARDDAGKEANPASAMNARTIDRRMLCIDMVAPIETLPPAIPRPAHTQREPRL